MLSLLPILIFGLIFFILILSNGRRSRVKGIKNNLHLQNEEMQRQQQLQRDEIQRQQNQQFLEWSMEEGRKSVTPVEHGGYDMTQGNSFNDHNMGGF